MFGSLNAFDYAGIVKLYIANKFTASFDEDISVSPIVKTKFKQLQSTGKEAEHYFLENYQSIEIFKNGNLEDARFYGDGYDFQVEKEKHFYLIEVKRCSLQNWSI